MIRTLVVLVLVCWGAQAQKWEVVDSIGRQYQNCIAPPDDPVGCAKSYFWALKDAELDLYGSVYHQLDSVQRKTLVAERQLWELQSNLYYAQHFKAFKTAYPKSTMTHPDRKSAPLAHKLFLDFAALVRQRIAQLRSRSSTP